MGLDVYVGSLTRYYSRDWEIFHNGSRVRLTELWLVFLFALGCPSFGPAPAGAADAAQDPVKLSFVFMGCNRIPHSDWKAIKHDEHLWDSSRLEEAPQVWQVVAGNAGSKLNSEWNPPGGHVHQFRSDQRLCQRKSRSRQLPKADAQAPAEILRKRSGITGSRPSATRGHPVSHREVIAISVRL